MNKNKILVVEDEFFIAKDLERILIGMDIEVEIALNYKTALSKALDFNPDLILCDINLGKENGIDLIKELKKQLRFKVIYITSYSNKEITQRASSEKLTNYVLKPYQEKQIEVSISLALEETNRQNKIWEELNLNELSPKEIEVLEYICTGIQTKEIAKNMFISPKTVEKHRSNISNKLVLENNKNGLLQWVLQHNEVIHYFL